LIYISIYYFIFYLYRYIDQMSWNRTKYDICAYNKDLSQSTSPINYALDPNKFYNCHDCRPELGLMSGNNVSVTGDNMVDLESDLFGITRANSKCPERKYIPHCHKCAETSGIPCQTGGCRKADNLSHLPTCRIIQYAPRIDHVGYNIEYPQCAKHEKGMINPPQMNPTHYMAQ
jgi:hypothetical protein